jgi:hypothetical protein
MPAYDRARQTHAKYPNRQVGDDSVFSLRRGRERKYEIPQPAGWGSFNDCLRTQACRAT